MKPKCKEYKGREKEEGHEKKKRKQQETNEGQEPPESELLCVSYSIVIKSSNNCH